MAVSLILNNNKGFKWFNNSRIYVKGYLIGNQACLFKEQNLIQYVDDVKDENDLLKRLADSNGSFSCVIDCGDEIFVVVDHIRSFPIFYLKEDDLIISDDAQDLKKKTKKLTLDKDAINEYLMTGYVTGDRTIYKEIKQLKAGEYLVYNKLTGVFQIKRHFNIKKDNETAPNIGDLNNTLEKIFEELIKSVGGRTIALPLSGGYDSRLIALYLKEMGYNDVICFTYGNLRETDVKISKEVANYLGYGWHIVPHTRKELFSEFNSKSMGAYRKFANNLSTLPHIQDWFAVEKLKEDKIIPEEAVFVPGHTAFLSFAGLIVGNIAQLNASNYIFNKHYSLWDKNLYSGDLIRTSMLSIDSVLFSYENSELFNQVDKIYFWEWQERHTKFICNSVRVYEFFDFEWRMPFWDKRLIELWDNVPVKDKLSKRMIKDYMSTRFVTSLTQPNPDRKLVSIFIDKMGSFIKRGRYNGDKNIFKSLLTKNKDIYKYVEGIPFINSNRSFYLEKSNAVAALRGLNELLDDRSKGLN